MEINKVCDLLLMENIAFHTILGCYLDTVKVFFVHVHLVDADLCLQFVTVL